MLKIIWSIIKITALLVAGIWLMSQSGDLNFSFLDYTVKMKTGLAMLLLAVSFFIVLSLLNFVADIASLPRLWGRHRQDQKNKSAMKALTKGFVALAAGDVDSAAKYTKEMKKLSSENTGLALLLQAQVARLKGNDGEARRQLLELIKDKDTAFLGVRGLMIAAMKQGDKEQALQYAHQAYAMHPRQPWIIKMVYDLEVQSRHWEKMIEVGRKAEKYKAMPVDRIRNDRVAYELMRYDSLSEEGMSHQAYTTHLKAAYKINPDFLPTLIRVARYYQALGKRKKVLGLIEKHWPHVQHPALAKIWDDLLTVKAKDKDKNTRRYEWNRRLIDMAPQSIDSYIAVAEVTIDMKMWREARLILMSGLQLMPTAKIYRLLTLAEKYISHQDDGVTELVNMADKALPDKRWTCSETGMVYDDWQAIAPPHNSFNTIIWDVPSSRPFSGYKTEYLENDRILFIDPVR